MNEDTLRTQNSLNSLSKDTLKSMAMLDKKYQFAIEFGKIFTWDYDLVLGKVYPTSNISFLNAPTLDNFPYSIIERNIIEPENVDDFLNYINKVKSGKDDSGFECWHHFTNNENPRYLKTKYYFDCDSNGHAIMAHGMGIDLTEEKTAELLFEHRTKATLKINPDSLASFQLNLSKNECSYSSVSLTYLSKLMYAKTSEEVFFGLSEFIPDAREKDKFLDNFSRNNLALKFSQGIIQITLEVHMGTCLDDEIWVRISADMVKNPLSNELEAIFHILNINNIKIVNRLVNGTVQREFDFIALAYINMNRYVILDKFSQELNIREKNFIEGFTEAFHKYITSERELNRVLEVFTLDNLIKKLNDSGEYLIQFNTNDNPQKGHHKLLRFSFLNNKKNVIAISCRDNTKIYNDDLKQKEALSNALIEAQKANRAKTDFLSLVSHDIRTPLNGIIGMLQLAMKEDLTDKVANYLSKAEMSSNYLLNLINDLLDMSKIESGKIKLTIEPYTYRKFSDYIFSVISPICKKKNITFTIRGTHSFKYLYTDKLRLNQIIFNILSNSCKYTLENGHIDLFVDAVKIDDKLSLVTFKISDDGIGMSKEFQNHIFEAFSQENRISLGHNEGTGLGLSITKSLIDLMGGEIKIESEINKGTTTVIQITFPYSDEITENNSGENKPVSVKKRDFTGYTFLLCEDNIINQEIAAEILKSFGADVEIAEDGKMGLEKFEKSTPNYYKAIFMDIRMPGMDGIESTRRIRELTRIDSNTVPIIAMTANAMNEDKIQCLEAGMNAFITKPIKVPELYKIMDENIP